jgi:hypothetical protein
VNSEVLISMIGFAGVCVGAIFGYMGRSRKHAAQDAKREQEQRDLFTQLFKALEDVKRRLDEHNHYAEKFGEIKLDIAGIKKDIEYIRKDLK